MTEKQTNNTQILELKSKKLPKNLFPKYRSITRGCFSENTMLVHHKTVYIYNQKNPKKIKIYPKKNKGSIKNAKY